MGKGIRKFFAQHWLKLLLFALSVVGVTIWTILKDWFASPYAFLTIPIVLLVVSLCFFLINQIQNMAHKKKKDYRKIITDWLFQYGYAAKRNDHDAAVWQISVISSDGTPPIEVCILKNEPDFISIGIVCSISPEEIGPLTALTGQADSTLIEDLRIEMGRIGIEYRNLGHPLKSIYLAQKMALDNTLTPLSFLQTFLRVKHAISMFQCIIIKYKKTHGIPIQLK
jgi:hypothetical protein